MNFNDYTRFNNKASNTLKYRVGKYDEYHDETDHLPCRFIPVCLTLSYTGYMFIHNINTIVLLFDLSIVGFE